MLKKLGKYQIKGILGQGAMGIVYDGFDPDIERRVAIKALHKDIITHASQREEFIARFKREAQAAAKCMHPNIVTVMDFSSDASDNAFMVMEYVDGVALSEYLKAGQSLKLELAINILLGMLKALNLAHSQGIIHRDIKPANIMMLKDGKVKLADFGIARTSIDSELTQAGTVIGTPKFMAPEQLGGESVDHRADLFSLAIVFLETLKSVPITNKLEYGTLQLITGLPHNNKVDYQQKIPAVFLSTLQKALSANRVERFSDAKAFFNAIKSDVDHLKIQMKGGNRPDIEKESQSVISTRPISSSGAESTSLSPVDLNLSNNLSENSTLFSSNINSDSFELDIDNDTLLELCESLTGLIGVSATKIVDEGMESAITFSELIQGLSHKIPNQKKRKQFIDKWSE